MSTRYLKLPFYIVVWDSSEDESVVQVFPSKQEAANVYNLWMKEIEDNFDGEYIYMYSVDMDEAGKLIQTSISVFS